VAPPRVYLAGPEVFLPDAAGHGRRKVELCRAHGFVGLFPLDAGLHDARAIFRANLAQMRSADLVIANLTPFRGPGADPGTVLELGFMAGLGKPTLGYTNDARDILARTCAHDAAARLDNGRWVDGGGLAIEDFGLAENLMIIGVLAEWGVPLVRRDVPAAERYNDLGGFAECLKLAAERFSSASSGEP
jgi:nucleoside 2-deoxyribosyltransferase